MDNWTSVFETDQLYKAELVKDILCNNDIDAVILNQKDSSYNNFRRNLCHGKRGRKRKS